MLYTLIQCPANTAEISQRQNYITVYVRKKITAQESVLHGYHQENNKIYVMMVVFLHIL